MPRHTRHSFIAFFPSDWIAGTAYMKPMHRLIYHDICVHCWDHGAECPAIKLPAMFHDIPDWRDAIDQLVTDGKLTRSKNGNVGNSRAIFEGKKAFAVWSAKSKGGKTRAKMLKDKKRLSKKNGAVESIVESTVESTSTPQWSPLENQNQNQRSKNHLSSLPSLGSGNGLRTNHSVTIADPDERLRRFQKSLADAFGSDGWHVIAAATDDTNPGHAAALAACQHVAHTLGKGWPTNWPTDERY